MAGEQTMTVAQALDLGRAHHAAGRMREAEAVYNQILAAHPNHPEALHLLGLLAHHCGNHAAAVELIERAILLNPNDFSYHHNVGEAYRALGQFDRAEKSFRRAIEINPNSATSHSSIGIVWASQGKLDHAATEFRKAVALDPTSPEARNNLGTALSSTGDYAEAVASFREAIRLRPQYIGALQNLGNTLLEMNKSEAAEAFQQVLRIAPNHPGAHVGLGIVTYGLVRLGQSIELLSRAVELDPNQSEAWNALGNSFRDQGRIDDALRCYEKAVSLAPHNAGMHSNLLLTLHSRDGNDGARMFEAHLNWARQHVSDVQPLPAPHVGATSDRKLRIGYVSGDFRVHSVAFFIEPLLAEHDREKFEITCYSDGKVIDDATNRIRSHVDRWRDIRHRSNESVAEQICADEIDILIDLSGHTSNGRMLMFARKPAPVQAMFLGYPNTSGLAAMDFRITDVHADPEGMTEKFYTEKLVRLPRTAWCYREPESVSRVARTSDAITFGSFNQLAKLTPQMIGTWSRILLSVPDSKLFLKTEALIDEPTRVRLLEEFGRHKISSERLLLLGRDASLADHLNRYNDIDIALDTFPYHGTTTTCDALWMGVPVITLAGQTHVSRVGVSLLSTCGLADLIADTEDAYIEKAVSLANDCERLTGLHSTLRTRLENSPVMNAKEFARDIEAAYLQMWQEHH